MLPRQRRKGPSVIAGASVDEAVPVEVLFDAA